MDDMDIRNNLVGYFSYQPESEAWINPGDFLGFSGGKIGYRYIRKLLKVFHSIVILVLFLSLQNLIWMRPGPRWKRSFT